MKKWITVALVGLMASILFLAVAQAQEAAPVEADKPTSLAGALGCFESFMSDVLDKIQANMAQIDTLNGKTDDLRNTLSAVSLEIKDAEGKIIGLRQDVDAMGAVQKGYGDRIGALEQKLSDLAAACDAVAKKVDVNQADIAALKDAVAALSDDYQAFKQSVQADIAAVQQDINGFKQNTAAQFSAVNKSIADLNGRVKVLEDQDVGTFKKKVIELERTMSALSIKIDNNRSKLEGFDQAFADFSAEIDANKQAILANKNLLEDHENRIAALESGTQLTDLQDQVNSLYFISIVALLAGVGALVWGFLGK
ncbi:MAG TPA: hypothetical protein ENF29_01455 [Candidatus Acetothermia bacterium]|nr:hypothetical protein [Candidatus Bipolaricaulota bacterium]HDJ29702.1 hypothetical protein [Candidatus Acetothermia bacterium]